MAKTYSSLSKAKEQAKKATTAYKADKIAEKALVRESAETLKMAARWSCALSKIDHFEVDVEYRNKNGVWAQLNNGTHSVPTTSIVGKLFTYTFTAPSDPTVTHVRYRVRAVAKTRKVSYAYWTKDKKGKKVKETYSTEKAYWTAAWSSYQTADAPAMLDAAAKAKTEAARVAAEELAARNAKPTSVPGKPSCALQANGSVRVQWSKPSESCVTRVYLCRCADGAGAGGRATLADLPTGTLEFMDSTAVPGHEYRYLIVHYNGNSKTWGPVGELSEPVQTRPLAPTGLSAAAAGAAEAVLTWDDNGYRYCGESYRVQHSEHADAWSAGRTDIEDVTNDLARIGSSNRLLVAGLDSGKTLYFRVALVGDGGTSEWSNIASVVLGSAPEAPTPAASQAGCELGNPLAMAWTHNSADGSAQSAAQVEVSVNGGDAETVEAGSAESLAYATDGLSDGDHVAWRVRTRGASSEWSPWSAWSLVTAYAKPAASLSLFSVSEEGAAAGQGEPLSSLPLVAVAEAGGGSQSPVLWAFELLAVEDFAFVGPDGEDDRMRAGSVMFSAYVDANDADFGGVRQVLRIGAGDGAFCAGVPFAVRARVTMDSGLVSDWASVEAVPEWSSSLPAPDADVEVLGDRSAVVRPACEDPRGVAEGEGWVLEGERLTVAPDGAESGALRVEYATALADGVYEDAAAAFPLVVELEGAVAVTSVTLDGAALAGSSYDAPRYVGGVTLAVYRIDAGGTLSLVQDGIPNTGAAAVADPHPRFGDGAYRIVANSAETDEVTVADVECHAPFNDLFVQWGERAADAAGDDGGGSLAYEGVELAASLTVKESASKDVTLSAYAGLARPVADYGTHVGKRVSYGAAFPEYAGSATVEALRALQEWMGPAYVRDRTGLGFWANVDVEVSHANADGRVRVALDVTPIEDPEVA